MTNQEFIESIRLEGEEWRDVVGWEGQYMVSNKNRAASLITEIKEKNGRIRHRNQRLLTVFYVKRNEKDYCHIILSRNGASIKQYMHRLVAKAFVPSPNDYPEVDHIDRDGTNNDPSNLRSVTHKMNQNNEQTRKAMSKSKIGATYPSRYRRVVQIKDGVVVRVYGSLKEVAGAGFSRASVSNVVRGWSHTSGGYCWMYLEDYEKSISSTSPGQPSRKDGTDIEVSV